MTERSLQSSVINYLSKLEECKVYNLHGSAWSGSGRPDLIGCYRSVTFVIELKLPGEHPTKIQEYELCKWRAAGAVAWHACKLSDVQTMISEIDLGLQHGDFFRQLRLKQTKTNLQIDHERGGEFD
jgi:hypothetical protein